MLNFNSTLVFSEDPEKLAEFYAKVFDKAADNTTDRYSMFRLGNGTVVIGPHEQVHGQSMNPERIMLNFETDDVHSEFERIKAIPATVIQEPYHPKESPEGDLATFVDPDGNYFQLISPMDM